MERRQLLKKMALFTGYVVATPTLMQILSSCEGNQSVNWQPLFLSEEQAYAVEKISNVIIPQGILPAASTVNTPQFVDLVLNEVVDHKTQNIFLTGARVFSSKFKVLTDKNILKADKQDFQKVVEVYFNLDDEEASQVIDLANSKEEDIIPSDTYYLYKYLLFIRYYTLFAYTSSELLYGEVLKYNPYTFTFTSCVSGLENES